MGQGNTGTIKRHENWPIMLSNFIHKKRHEPFVWGKNDCILFAFDAVLAITGVDLPHEYRGNYSTAHEARAIIERDFDGDISKIFIKAFGAPIKNNKMCKRGDVVIKQFNGTSCSGFVDDSGTKAVFLSLDRGYVYAPIDETMLIWTY